MLVFVGLALLINIRNADALPMARVNGSVARPPALHKGETFHLFLSHIWSSGQDQMRVVKTRLLEMVPKLRIFVRFAHYAPSAFA